MSPLRLAWLNLVDRRFRTLLSLAGVAVTAILVFMQLGFLGSVERTATLLYDHLDFDLLLLSPEYLDLGHAGDLPRRRLAQARAVPGVERALALSARFELWRDPRPLSDRRLQPRRWNILVLGADPATLPDLFPTQGARVFRSRDELTARQTALTRRDTVVIDRSSWPEFGSSPDWRPEVPTELNDTRVEVVGDFEIGTGFGYNGLLLTSEDTLAQVDAAHGQRVTFGLVKLVPGVAADRVRDRLKDLLPQDVQVLTREEINARERAYWVGTTSVGQFFTVGVAIALLVGGIFVYQMIVSEIRHRLPEFATVRALGYPGGYLSWVVLGQAVLLALVGYLPGLFGALGCYELTRQAARVPIRMTAACAGRVLVFVLVMCLCSGLLAVRKARKADPADLF